MEIPTIRLQTTAYPEGPLKTPAGIQAFSRKVKNEYVRVLWQLLGAGYDIRDICDAKVDLIHLKNRTCIMLDLNLEELPRPVGESVLKRIDSFFDPAPRVKRKTARRTHA